MNLKHSLDIPSDHPFKNDKLKREEEAKTLTKLVQNYSDGFVLALNNEWGAGKTTFVKMWQDAAEDGRRNRIHIHEIMLFTTNVINIL